MSGNGGSLVHAAWQPCLWRRLSWLPLAAGLLFSASTVRESPAGPIAAWSLGGRMGQSAAVYQTALLLPDGYVLATDNQTASLYDPAAGRWSPTARLVAFHRPRYSLTLLSNGRVLVVGGENRAEALAGAEIYNPMENIWTNAGALRFPRAAHRAVLLPDGLVLVFGGGNLVQPAPLTSTELFDPAALNLFLRPGRRVHPAGSPMR